MKRAKHAYSYRNALTGSRRVARRAGRKQAASETNASSAAMTRASCCRGCRSGPACSAAGAPTPIAPPMPMARPMASCTSAPRRTSHQTCGALGAERHPHADLLRPLRDRVRRDRVEADRRQRERDQREHAEHRAEHLELPSSLRERRVERHDAEERQIGIDGAHFLAHRRRQRRRIAGCAQHQERKGRRLRAQRDVDDGVGKRFLEVALAHRRRDADDRDDDRRRGRRHRRRLCREPNPPADRVFAGEMHRDESLVDDRGLVPGSAVERVERAAARQLQARRFRSSAVRSAPASPSAAARQP